MSAPTYESTLQFHGLSVEQMKDECCDEVLHALAKKMNRWRNIRLGVDKGVIEGIENDRSTDDEGKRNKLLERWKQKFGHDATYERMVRALMKSERTDLADVVCEELKEILALNIQREPQQTRSYDSTLELHGLESAQMQEVCSDEVLSKLAKKMTHWQSIDLGVDKSVVQSIENDRSTDDEGKRSSLLERWKQMNGVEATYERLVQSLLTSLRTDLADVVCEELKEALALTVLRGMRSVEDTDNEDSVQVGNFPAQGEEPSVVENSAHTDADLAQILTVEDTGIQVAEDESLARTLSMAPPLPSKSEQYQSWRNRSPPPIPPYRPFPLPRQRYPHQDYSYPSEERFMAPAQPINPPVNSSSTGSQLESMVVTVFTSLLNEERNTSSGLRMRVRIHEQLIDRLCVEKRDVETRLSDKENKIVRLNERVEEAQTKLNKARKKRNKAKDTVTQKDTEVAAQRVELERLKQEHARLAAERAVQDQKLTQATDRVQTLQNDVEKAQCEADIARQEKVELTNTLRRRDQELDAVKDETKQLKYEVKSEQQQLAIYRQILYITIILLVLLAGVVLY